MASKCHFLSTMPYEAGKFCLMATEPTEALWDKDVTNPVIKGVMTCSREWKINDTKNCISFVETGFPGMGYVRTVSDIQTHYIYYALSFFLFFSSIYLFWVCCACCCAGRQLSSLGAWASYVASAFGARVSKKWWLSSRGAYLVAPRHMDFFSRPQ